MPADAPLSEGQVARARELFTKYDADGSGQVDKAELRALLGELNLRLDDDLFSRYVDRYWCVARRPAPAGARACAP